jgi:hypothetical protein
MVPGIYLAVAALEVAVGMGGLIMVVPVVMAVVGDLGQVLYLYQELMVKVVPQLVVVADLVVE